MAKSGKERHTMSYSQILRTFPGRTWMTGSIPAERRPPWGGQIQRGKPAKPYSPPKPSAVRLAKNLHSHRVSPYILKTGKRLDKEPIPAERKSSLRSSDVAAGSRSRPQVSFTVPKIPIMRYDRSLWSWRNATRNTNSKLYEKWPRKKLVNEAKARSLHSDFDHPEWLVKLLAHYDDVYWESCDERSHMNLTELREEAMALNISVCSPCYRNTLLPHIGAELARRAAVLLHASWKMEHAQRVWDERNFTRPLEGAGATVWKKRAWTFEVEARECQRAVLPDLSPFDILRWSPESALNRVEKRPSVPAQQTSARQKGTKRRISSDEAGDEVPSKRIKVLKDAETPKKASVKRRGDATRGPVQKKADSLEPLTKSLHDVSNKENRNVAPQTKSGAKRRRESEDASQQEDPPSKRRQISRDITSKSSVAEQAQPGEMKAANKKSGPKIVDAKDREKGKIYIKRSDGRYMERQSATARKAPKKVESDPTLKYLKR